MVDAETKRPLIIYAMPRSRSLATLSACKRSQRLVEPFSLYNLNGQVDDPFAIQLRAYATNQVSPAVWNDLIWYMRQPWTASKIFGYHIHEFKPAQHWWRDVQARDEHDIYVLARDRLQLCISFFMASAYGFYLREQRPLVPSELDPMLIHTLDYKIDCHLRYFPTRGRLITWDTLPPEDFDTALVGKPWRRAESQDYQQKQDLISNMPLLIERAQEVLAWHKDEWDAKESALSH